MTIEAKGFSYLTQKDLKLATGALPNVNITLKLGATAETVEVNAEAAMVDVTQVKVQSNVTAEILNGIPKHGSNQWHGEGKVYYQGSGLDANDACASGFTSNGSSTVCGLRLDPTKASLNQTTRLDGTPQYYVPKKDNRHITEPGFELGGPILRDKLWLYTSYIPSFDYTTPVT